MFRVVVWVWLFAAWAGIASAASLRFDATQGPSGPVSGVVGRTLGLEGAQLSAARRSELFIYRTADFGLPDGGGFCAVVRGFTCKGRATLRFETPVSGLTFNAFFAGRGDRARVNVFAGDVRLRSILVRRNGLIDLSGLEGITHITFRDRSSANGTGIAWGNFSYDDAITPVPVPAAGLLLAGAVALVAGGSALTRASRTRPGRT